jgi:hypothetical protein
LALGQAPAWAAATLLPNGKQCFEGANGAYVSGSLNMFQPGTTTPKSTWQDAAQTTLNSQPIQLDSNGCAIIYGTGSYRQQLYDGPVVGGVTTGSLIWDQLTTDTSANNNTFWAGIAAGTPNALTVVDPGFNATDGSIINFTANATNTGTATLNPSSFGAISILKDTTSGPVSLAGGEIVQNNPISVVYRAFDNAFHLLNPPIQSAGGSTAPLCGATGLKIVNNTGAPNTAVDVTIDSLVMVSPTGTVLNRSNVAVTLNFQVNGANGLDTGALANSSIYNVWMIDNGAAPAALGSLSAVAPTLPTGYTYKCRMGAYPTDGSAHLLQAIAYGSETQLTTSAAFTSNLVNGTCLATFSAVAFSSIPPTATIAIGKVLVQNTASAGVGRATAGPSIASVIAATAATELYFRAAMTTAQTVFYCSNNAGNALSAFGWVDKVNAH